MTTAPGRACGRCGRDRSLRYRTSDGQPLCRSCYTQDESRWETCQGCRRRRPVNARTADGHPLCVTCCVKTQPPARCHDCGTVGPVAVRADGRSDESNTLCRRCYRNPKRTCGRCGRVRRVAVRATATTPDLCPTCHQAPVETCSICGETDLCRRTTENGKPWCFRCQLHQRLDELLTGHDGHILPNLVPIRDAVASVDNPRTALGWLARSRGADLLARIAQGERPLEHATLDAEPSGTAIEHLRRLLVAAGALPERNEHLARLEHFTRDLAARLTEAADRKLLQTYATWHVLHRLRANQRRRPITANAAYRARADLTAAARFLTHLRAHDRDPATCRQTDLDAWITSAASAQQVRSFLTWASRRRLITGIEQPTQVKSQPRHFGDDEQRWMLARRLMHDDGLSAADRVAGALVLLYAQPPARIVRLTVDHLRYGPDGETLLRLGSDDAHLPEPLASLVRQLPDRAPPGMAAHLAGDAPWLFPGRQPGRPLHPGSLRLRLTKLGVSPRADRNTALLQLAAELPAVVLADLLGLHINTAADWVDAAGGALANYAAARGATGRA